jgi:F1F0 ATPase subunit 2
MNSLETALGAIWGTCLGIFYFGGLWLTVRRVRRAARPGRLLLLSLAGRAAAALACFLWLLRQGTFMFGVAVLFFFLTRFLITGLAGRPGRGRMHAN